VLGFEYLFWSILHQPKCFSSFKSWDSHRFHLGWHSCFSHFSPPSSLVTNMFI